MSLSLTINETLKWLSSLPILMQESFWRSRRIDRYIISLFPHLPSFSPSLINLMASVDVKLDVYLLHPHTPFHPFSPFLISIKVSVDVKHHVYLLTHLLGDDDELMLNVLRCHLTY